MLGRARIPEARPAGCAAVSGSGRSRRGEPTRRQYPAENITGLLRPRRSLNASIKPAVSGSKRPSTHGHHLGSRAHGASGLTGPRIHAAAAVAHYPDSAPGVERSRKFCDFITPAPPSAALPAQRQARGTVAGTERGGEGQQGRPGDGGRGRACRRPARDHGRQGPCQ